jgi:hypothetical protein
MRFHINCLMDFVHQSPELRGIIGFAMVCFYEKESPPPFAKATEGEGGATGINWR